VTALACEPEHPGLSTPRAPRIGGATSSRSASRGRGVTLASVRPQSPAHSAGLLAADLIVGIDGVPIHDFLDFYLGSFGGKHDLDVLRKGRRVKVRLVRGMAEDVGAEMVLDGPRPCNNRCVFCFIDQLPPGLRRELYFKDEDYRLSFLHGNYLTLTNLRSADERRITAEHLSPLYVSVHSTNQGIRSRLLGRKPREPVLTVLRRLGKRGVRFHAQVVVVPGYNDGDDLVRTLRDLIRLGRAVLSISVVPVGLTAHRRRLAGIGPVDAGTAGSIVDRVGGLNARLRARTGRGVVYASDEMIILAGRAIPDAGYYDDYPQIENGVGLVRQLVDQLKPLRIPASLRGKRVLLVTGRLARPFIDEVAARLTRGGLKVSVKTVTNSLFGPSVTVSGLLPGKAIISALRGPSGWDAAILPPDVANGDHLTLDDISVSQIGQLVGRPVLVADHSLRQTIKALAAMLERN
jgi:putative radical SAM enzyme (TIGR03279 family)